jgi:predicted metal-dependent enzyme (double-stranded beta helix superfamily)
VSEAVGAPGGEAARDGAPGGEAAGHDQYAVNTAPFHAFVASATATVERHADAERAIAELREPFSKLLWNDDWLPDAFAVPAVEGGMGGGIGSYLLYRNAARSLSISSLVVPAGAMTPIHDHLGWGLVGLYRGEQHEEVFRRTDGGERDGRAHLDLVDRRHLRRGDFYELIPPDGDIHRVVAANQQPSVSIHLLRNDVGCIERHSFDLEARSVRPFRSGYVNVECKE